MAFLRARKAASTARTSSALTDGGCIPGLDLGSKDFSRGRFHASLRQHALSKQQQISITKITQMATQTHHGELESRSNHPNDPCAHSKAVASDTAGTW